MAVAKVDCWVVAMAGYLVAWLVVLMVAAKVVLMVAYWAASRVVCLVEM